MKVPKLFTNKPARSIALCMLIVALLPLLCGWVFYAQSNRTVRSQQQDIVDQSTQLTIQKLDADLQEMSSIALRLKERVWRLELPAEDEITAEHRLSFLDARGIMRDFLADAPSYIERIYVSREGVDYVVQDSAVLGYDVLAKNAWNGDVTAEDLRLLQDYPQSGMIVPVGENRVAFIMNLSSGSWSNVSDRQLVFVITPYYLDKIARNYGLPGAHYELCDRLGKTVLTQNEEPESDAVNIAHSFASGNYQLVSKIPREYLQASSSALSMLYFELLAITLLVGALLIRYLSHRSVMPINQLIGYIQRNYRVDDEENVEGLNLVFHAVEHMLNEHQIHLEHLRQYQEQAEMHELAEAFQGYGNSESSVSGPFVVAALYIGDFEEALDHDRIRSVVMGVSGRSFRVRCAFLPDVMCLLLEKQQGNLEMDEAERFLERLLEQLDNSGFPGIHGALSLVHHSAAETEIAYREAGMALDCFEKRPEINVLRFDDVRYTPEYFLRDWHHLDKQLTFARQIGAQEYGEARKTLGTLFPEEFLGHPNSTLAQLHLSSLKYQFLHDVDVLSGDFADSAELSRAMSRGILSCKTHRALLEKMDSMLADLKMDEPEDEIHRIKAYIRQNAFQQQLTVTSVAEAFDMPIDKLSKLFSHCAGMGVLQYIHKIRIEHACNLLLSDEKLTIAEIAGRVGYSSALTFNRAFKARYEMTPGEYRKAHACEK